MLNDVARRTGILEEQLTQAFAIIMNLPSQWQLEQLTQRMVLAESHVQALTTRVGVTHITPTHPQFKHNTPSAHLEGQVSELRNAAVSADAVNAFMDELMK